MTIKEPEFLLLPEVTATRPNLMDLLVDRLDANLAEWRSAFKAMAESFLAAKIAALLFSILMPRADNHSVYARRRVRKLVDMQRRRRNK